MPLLDLYRLGNRPQAVALFSGHHPGELDSPSIAVGLGPN